MQKMTKKILALLSAFIISINCFCSMPLTVFASGSLSGFNSWSDEDKFSYFSEHLISILGQAISIYINPGSADYHSLLNMFEDLSADKIVADNSADYKEYIVKRLRLNDSGELVVDDELSDLMYQVSNEYIKNYTPYCNFVLNTPDIVLGSECSSIQLYELQKNWNNDECFMYECGTNFCPTELSELGYVANEIIYYIEVPYNIDFVFDDMGKLYAGTGYRCDIDMYKEWEPYCPERVYLDLEGNEIYREKLTTNVVNFYSLQSQGQPYYGYKNCAGEYYYSAFTSNRWVGKSGSIRAYFSVADMKNYSVSTRPYLTTSDFYNYDSSQDNSVTLSESDLSNGSVYGDVYNYITNNYDNPNGLSEDELIRILETYLNNNSGGGSGSSGNGSGSGSSGNGLMDFLGGLGSIGDAILSILGKLMEYIGKALDLIGGTVTKVIDIIPKNITALLGALFPFFPEEWLTAIELGLVLAVIVGIVGLFKK